MTALVLALAACAAPKEATAPPTPTDPAKPVRPTDPPSVPVVSRKDAARFLLQASFGGTMAQIEAVAADGYEVWFTEQLSEAPTLILPPLKAIHEAGGTVDKHAASDAVWDAYVSGEDQLRLRMSYALSQILVVSDASGGLQNRPLAIAHYADTLQEGAFGNYRDLLEDVTYAPAMARWLTYFRNKKADPATGAVPDENYARELLQLFTIGLIELNRDGTVPPGAAETYDNDDIQALAKVFTGLGDPGGFTTNPANIDYAPLEIDVRWHSGAQKRFLDTTIPAGTAGARSIDLALDHIFAHPNVAPFVGRQLIQRLVTSAPSPAYVDRVSLAFERGTYTLPSGAVVGTTGRGDLTATLAAILFDPEARQKPENAEVTHGKVREPVLRFVQWARAFEVAGVDARAEALLKNAGNGNRLTQAPYAAPSVFNFYRPGYVAPASETGARGLTAPELQITSEATQLQVLDFMATFIRDRAGTREAGQSDGYAPAYAAERALAEDVDALIDRVDLLVTAGRMTTQTRAAMRTVLSEIEVRDGNRDTDIEKRVHLAVFMAIAAPEAQVQR